MRNIVEETITIDTEPLIQLIEATGQRPEDALKYVRVLVTSSADQQANLTAELERIRSSKNTHSNGEEQTQTSTLRKAHL